MLNSVRVFGERIETLGTLFVLVLVFLYLILQIAYLQLILYALSETVLVDYAYQKYAQDKHYKVFVMRQKTNDYVYA